jgi:tetratricopeptide (TPR) repeat protein
MIPEQEAIDGAAEIMANRPPAPNSAGVRDTVNMNTSGQENLNVGINNGTIVNQRKVPQPRKASLFQLPKDSPDFTGRSAVTTQIETILERSAIVAISGMGGVGKSMLARHVGNRLKAVYPDGQLVVDLRGQSESPREPIAVLTEFLIDGFGEDPQHLPIELDRLQNLFTDRLTGRRILVMLDNAADAAQVEPLLVRVVGCGAIVTSRETIANLSGVTEASQVRLGVLEIDEAVELLNRLCETKTNDRSLTIQLANLCGRLPLALTIVGRLLSQTRSLSIGELIVELGDERSRLDRMRYVDARDRIDPNLDVRASFNLSYRRLNEAQQQVFGAVSVLPGAHFGVALAAVLGAREETEVRRLLEQLEQLQLVLWEAGRYGFHDLVRVFGRETLAEGQERELAELALGWYKHNSKTFDDYLTSATRRPIAERLVSEWEQPLETIEKTLDTLAVEWFLAEHQNLVRAVDWAQALNEHQIAVGLACNLVIFFQRRGLWSDWVTTHQVALKSARAIGDQHGIGQTMNNLGLVYSSQGKWEEAIDYFQKSLETKRPIGNDHGISQSVMNIGLVYQSQGKWEEAIDCYQQSLETFRAIGDQHGIAQTMTNLGNVYRSQVKWEEAIACFQQSLETFRAIGDSHGIAQTMNNLGNVYYVQGGWEEAIDCYQQSLETKRKLGDQHGIGNTIENFGNVYQAQGKWEEAIDCYQQSLVIKHAIGDTHGIATTIGHLGVVYQAQGKWEEAIDCYQQSLETKRVIGDQHGIAITIGNLGNVYKAQGKWDDAIDCYQQSLETKRRLGDRHGTAQVLQNLAAAYQQTGRIKESFALSQESNQIYMELGILSQALPKWVNTIIKFAQKGRNQMIACFIGGIFAFPFMLIAFITLMLWRLTIGRFRS